MACLGMPKSTPHYVVHGTQRAQDCGESAEGNSANVASLVLGRTKNRHTTADLAGLSAVLESVMPPSKWTAVVRKVGQTRHERGSWERSPGLTVLIKSVSFGSFRYRDEA
jgi:hypothetical protein